MSKAITPEAVLAALSNVMDPDLHKDIVSLGFVKDLKISGDTVSCKIELTTPACPVKDLLKKQAVQNILSVPGVKTANVEMTAQVRSARGMAGANLPGIKNIIPVASAKGGVGKSTVSANLALALSKRGAKVGLMDADIYGPSIPTLMGITANPTPKENNMIEAVDQYGIKVMSMGFFLPSDKAVIWRGPMLNKMITQFLGGVEWGELDYLVVDLPPGTGDVQLTLCQQVPLTGAVIVSTPQSMALNIAKKAIYMFQQLNCPILGVIENMSYYVTESGKKDHIFGEGGAQKFAKESGIPFLGEVPISTDIRTYSDQGKPIVIAQPESVAAAAFMTLAENLAAQISILNVSGELKQDIKVSF